MTRCASSLPTWKELRMWNREQNGLHLIIRACNNQLIKQRLCLKGSHDESNLSVR